MLGDLSLQIRAIIETGANSGLVEGEKLWDFEKTLRPE